MEIVCPDCRARFIIDPNRVSDKGVRFRCSNCSKVFKVTRKPRESKAAHSVDCPAGSPERIRLLVANESPAFCSAVAKVLSDGPFDLISYNDGRDAMAAIEVYKPDVVLLDVALPSMYGFEICEQVRRSPALDSVKLILVASIYDKTRYKRTPASLYGADAYIEKHHIPDSLARLVCQVFGKEPAGDGVAPGTDSRKEQEAARRLLKRDEENSVSLTSTALKTIYGEESEGVQKSKRLARIIVSDILLYNQSRVEEGVRNGTFFELLSEEIKEGRALYNSRIPSDIAAQNSFLDEAFDRMIAAKRQEMNL